METSNLDKTKKQVGAQIPGRLFQLINLHSHVKEFSRSQILRDALLLWAEENQVDLEQLIQEQARLYKAEWYRVKESLPISKEEFLARRKKILERNKVTPEIAQRIIEAVDI